MPLLMHLHWDVGRKGSGGKKREGVGERERHLSYVSGRAAGLLACVGD